MATRSRQGTIVLNESDGAYPPKLFRLRRASRVFSFLVSVNAYGSTT